MASIASNAIPNEGNIYDDCLISSCLRKLCKQGEKSPRQELVVCKHVAEIRTELELVNHENVIELSYAYLAAMERSMPGAGFRYLLIYQNGTPVLFAYFQLITLTSLNFRLEKNTGFVKGIVRFFLGLKKINALFLGNALRNEAQSYCFDATAMTSEEALKIVTSAAEKIAVEDKTVAILLTDTPSSLSVGTWLASLGYRRPFADSVMVLDIDESWKDIQGYTTALSRKYKARANKIIAAGSSITVKKLNLQETLTYEQRIYELFRQVADTQPFVLLQDLPGHFTELKKVYEDNFELFGFFDGSELVAFFSAFVSEGDYDIYYVGFDYIVNGKYQLYFNILFSALARAIALNKKQLKLGRTSFDAKASLGARAEATNYLIKIVGIPSVVTNWFANYFKAMEDAQWKLRNPLKQPHL